MKHSQTLALTSAVFLTTTFARAQSVQPQSVELQSNQITPSPTVSMATSIAQTSPQLATSVDTTNVASKQSSTDKAAKFASKKGTLLFLAGSLAMPFLGNDEHATQHSLRTADAILTSTLLTEGLKRVFREKRPDTDEHNSFPSGHATVAFAAATMASHFRPKQSVLWFTGATLIALSRVKLKRHYVHDVVAGAAIGYGVARLEISQPRGLLLSPFIKRDEGSHNNQMGFSIGGTF